MNGLSLTTRGFIPHEGVNITTWGLICPSFEEEAVVRPVKPGLPVILDLRDDRFVPSIFGGFQQDFAALVAGSVKTAKPGITGFEFKPAITLSGSAASFKPAISLKRTSSVPSLKGGMRKPAIVLSAQKKETLATLTGSSKMAKPEVGPSKKKAVPIIKLKQRTLKPKLDK